MHPPAADRFARSMDAVIGTAGWSVPRDDAYAFPSEGTSLERYARVFAGVEVNSSFHRPHRTSTWERWAASVPDTFRFAVKIPKTITHQAKLVDTEPLIEQFGQQVQGLGSKLAVLLVQLPPKLAFDPGLAERFFACLRAAIPVQLVCEPRHATWFEPAADALLKDLRIARAAADPALCAAAAVPGGWVGLPYWRLHGSPMIYRSAYSEEAIDGVASALRDAMAAGTEPWCVFDNTAASAATGNALSLRERIEGSRR